MTPKKREDGFVIFGKRNLISLPANISFLQRIEHCCFSLAAVMSVRCHTDAAVDISHLVILKSGIWSVKK